MVAIFYYSTDFFKSAGIEQTQAQYATIGVGAIMVAMTVVTIPLMDRAGRRTLHLVSFYKNQTCSHVGGIRSLKENCGENLLYTEI